MSGSLHAFWRRLDRPGHDAARLSPSRTGWTLEGYAAFEENGPTGVHYRLYLDPDYATAGAAIDGHRCGEGFAHAFARTAEGWLLDGRLLPGLVDLVHLDFGFTPATNLPQVLHAALAVGAEAEIPAAWFDIGMATLARLPQVYRRIAEDRYEYSSPSTGYEAVLELAESGFAKRYPGLWEMEPLHG